MIRIEVPATVPSGNYTANAYQEGEMGVVATATHASRLTAIANVLTALAANVRPDLEKEPITIVTPRVPNVV